MIGILVFVYGLLSFEIEKNRKL